MSSPPPRRMAKPQNIAAIMKRSDLEEEDSPDDELLAITCFSPLAARRRQAQKKYGADSVPPDAAEQHRGALTSPSESAKSPFTESILPDTILETSRRKNAAPGTRVRAAQMKAAFYWFGRRSCVNPGVLISRNIGVCGGRSKGFRKFASNW